MDIEYLNDANHRPLWLSPSEGSWAREEAPAASVTLGSNTSQYTY